jgi:hypothetical protein
MKDGEKEANTERLEKADEGDVIEGEVTKKEEKEKS